MTPQIKRILLLIVIFLFVFALLRIGTSTYENIIRDLPKQ